VKAESQGLCLRIYIHESLSYDHHALYEAMVALARREGLANATVYRAMEGFGRHRHLHTSRLVDVSDDLTMIVEFVDAEPAIRHFVGLLDAMVPHGTATLSPVQIVTYRAERPA
jgi:uncharacterized protein